MPTKLLTIYPINKGLFTSVNVGLAPSGSLAKSDNVVSSSGGAGWKKSPGIKRYDVSGLSGTDNVIGLFDFWRSSGNGKTQSLVCISGARIYSDSGVGEFSDITGSLSLVENDPVSFGVFSGVLIMSFKNSTPLKYTGTGNVQNLGGNPPDFSIFRVAKRRLFTNDKSNPDRIFITAAGTIEDFDRGDSIDLDEGDQDPSGVTAIFQELHGDVYVSKRESLYRLRLIGSSDFFGVQESIPGVGCVSHNAVVAIQNDIIFPSSRGIHSLVTTERFGDVESTFLSAKIHDIYEREVDLQRADQMWAVFSQQLNSYILSYPRIGAPYNQDAFVYNLINQEWSLWRDFNITSIANFVDNSRFASSKSKRVVACGSYDNKIGILDEKTLTRFGDSVKTTITTNVHYPFGFPSRNVGWKNLYLMYKPKGNYNFDVTFIVDGDVTGSESISQSGSGRGVELGKFKLGSSKLGSLGSVKTIGIPLQGVGKGIQFIFSQNPSTLSSLEEDIEILAYSIEYDDYGTSSVQKVI